MGSLLCFIRAECEQSSDCVLRWFWRTYLTLILPSHRSGRCGPWWETTKVSQGFYRCLLWALSHDPCSVLPSLDADDSTACVMAACIVAVHLVESSRAPAVSCVRVAAAGMCVRVLACEPRNIRRDGSAISSKWPSLAVSQAASQARASCLGRCWRWHSRQ